VTPIIGILLALGCAAASTVAFLCKHRGAERCAPVRWRHPLRSAIALWRSPWFALGMGIGALAWGMHVAAMSLAPLSAVQAVIAGGIVMLGVLGERLFGLEVGPRQRWGLALTALGLVLLSLTLRPASSHDGFSPTIAVVFEGGLLGVGALLLLGHRFGAPAHRHAIFLAAAAGLLFGVANVGVKALLETTKHGGWIAALDMPWAPIAIAASVVAFYSSARSLQLGSAVAVIAITGTTANIAGIAGGILVFSDPMPGDPLGIVVQASAFVLVVIASALVPGPIRAPAPTVA